MLALEPTLPLGKPADGQSGALMRARWRLDSPSATPAAPEKKKKRKSPAKGSLSLTGRRQAVSVPAPVLPGTISSRHAVRQQILDRFLHGFMPQSALWTGHRAAVKERNWLLHIQDVTDPSPALESSLLALCVARIGRQQGDDALRRQALTHYTEGLRLLNDALRKPATRKEDNTVAACLALMTYELTECPAMLTQGYVAHFQGAVDLMRLRGPEAHVSGLGRSMFHLLRIQCVG